MPTSVKQLGGAVTDTVVITWQFEANLSDLPPDGITFDAPGPVPLPGDWQLELQNDSDDSDKLRLSFHHGSLPVGAFGKSVTGNIHLARVVGTVRRLLRAHDVYEGLQPALDPKTSRSRTGYSLPVSRSKLAANGRWPTSEQNSLQQYCCTLILERDLQSDTARSHLTPTADLTKAKSLAGTLHTRHADVCLRFWRPGDAYLELWTTSGLLATASDYYKTLLASGYAETVPSGSKRQRSEAPPPIEQKPFGQGTPAPPTIDWQDSDDEMDDLLVERNWAGCKTAKHDSTEPEYQQIDVRETAYSTMNAVLLYLMTGHIEFAPLTSQLGTRSQDVASTRRELLDKHVSKHPTLPPPVSPKSVYRLAHLLQREELQQLALNALSTSFTTDGAAHELFSPVSIAYAEVKNVVLNYIAQNCEEVQASESWNGMREKATAGEIEGAAQILFDLLRMLHGKESNREPAEKQK